MRVPTQAIWKFSQPNKLKLLSRVQGVLIATLVSDGKSVSQWDDSQYVKQTAAASFQDIHRRPALWRCGRYCRRYAYQAPTAPKFHGLEG